MILVLEDLQLHNIQSFSWHPQWFPVESRKSLQTFCVYLSACMWLVTIIEKVNIALEQNSSNKCALWGGFIWVFMCQGNKSECVYCGGSDGHPQTLLSESCSSSGVSIHAAQTFLSFPFLPLCGLHKHEALSWFTAPVNMSVNHVTQRGVENSRHHSEVTERRTTLVCWPISYTQSSFQKGNPSLSTSAFPDHTVSIQTGLWHNPSRQAKKINFHK